MHGCAQRAGACSNFSGNKEEVLTGRPDGGMQRTGRIARHVVAKPAASRPAAVATAAAARASSTAAAAEGPLSEEQVERYHRDGFVVRISSPCAAVDVTSAWAPGLGRVPRLELVCPLPHHNIDAQGRRQLVLP